MFADCGFRDVIDLVLSLMSHHNLDSAAAHSTRIMLSPTCELPCQTALDSVQYGRSRMFSASHSQCRATGNTLGRSSPKT